MRGNVLREGLLFVAAGLALGLPAAIAAAQLVKSLLFGVSPLDPAALAAATLGLLAVAAAAAYLPAWRASRTDPMRALRHE